MCLRNGDLLKNGKKKKKSCWFEWLNLEQGQHCGTEEAGEAAKMNKEGVSVCHEKVWAKPMWEVLTLSFLNTVEPGGPLSSQNYTLLLWV